MIYAYLGKVPLSEHESHLILRQ